MVKLHFKTTDDFEELFTSKKKSVTDAIVEGIQIAIEKKRKTAMLFDITFEEAEQNFEISLPSVEWKQALGAALDHYHEIEASDECIDTWQLLEKVKKI